MTVNVNAARSIGKEATWIVIGQAVTVVGGLVLIRVLTEFLEPSLYGELTLGLALATLANQVLMGGVASGVMRFYSISNDAHDLRGYIQSSGRLMAYALFAVLIICLAAIVGLIWFGYSHFVGLTAALSMFALINGFNSVLNGLQNAARQRAVVALHSGLNAWLKILLAVGMVLWLGVSNTHVVVGFLVASFFVSCSQLVFLLKLIRPKLMSSVKPTDWTGQMWSYSWPFTAWALFTWAQQISDRWALQVFGTSEDVGLYAVVFQLGYTPIGLISSMVVTLIGPIFFQKAGAGNNPSINASVHSGSWNLAFASIGITFLGCFISFVFHERIFQLIVAEQYRAVSSYLPWIVLAGGLFAAGQLLALKLLSEMRSKDMLLVKITSAIIGITLNLIGAATFGLPGVIAGLVGFSLVYVTWVARLARRQYE